MLAAARRCALFASLLVTWSAAADAARAQLPLIDGLKWYDIRELGVEGRGWNDTKDFYDRLPAKAEKLVRPAVWSLSRNSSGMCVRFVTDATTIAARWKLRSDRLSLVHMAATGVSGVDLYGLDSGGQWRWIAVGRPDRFPENSQVLAAGIRPGRREYMLYLPLYNGVESVEIGLPPAARLDKAPPRPAGAAPIVFYGTSITQGACASRPGMTYSAILGRQFNRPIINLGFSGNGKMEPEVASLLAELDPSVYVINCLPNMTAEEVDQRAVNLVQTLRQAHPETPILLVEDRSYADAPWLAARENRNVSSRSAFKQAHDKLAAAGVKGLFYVPGDGLLGADRDDTVDGSHPSDLGFMRMAEALGRVLGPLLGRH